MLHTIELYKINKDNSYEVKWQLKGQVVVSTKRLIESRKTDVDINIKSDQIVLETVIVY